MLGLGKKKKAEGYKDTPDDLIEKSYKDIKEVVDGIFSNTESLRKEMTHRLNEYRNKVWKDSELEGNESQISFNFLFAIVSTISALVTDSKPKARIIPEFPFFNGVISEAYNRNLDYLWDALELQDEVYKTVVWSLIAKLGICEVGYCKGQGKYGMYYDIIDPRDFFIAPGYDDIWKAPFCGYRQDVPISKVKELFPDAELDADVFYNVDKDNKAVDEQLKYTDAKDNFFKSKAGRIRWYKVWMRTDELLTKDGDDKIKAFPNGVTVYFTENKYLGLIENEYLHNLPPFVSLGDYYNPGMFDSIGEGDQISSITKEINVQLQAMMDRAKRENDAPMVADVDMLGDVIEQIKTDRQTGESGQIYAYSSANSQSGRPPISQMYPAEQGATAWTIVSSFKGIIEYISGFTDILRGEAQKSERQSAVEVSILSEASSVRIRPKIRSLESFIKRVTYLYVCLMQQYWLDDHWIYTKTDDGEEYHNFSSTRLSMQEMIIPKEELEGIEERMEMGLDPETAQQKQAYDDYTRFMEWADGETLAPDSPAMFPFEIEVQADSSLPLDKQSKANLFLRLYAMKAVDRQALLESLEIPNSAEINKRMGQMDKAAKTMQSMKGQEAKNV